ncbi:MAG TPA: hypothetical protein VFS47_06565, partial [Steroidobacteraceae bacterium]|nr:hypothetical protein [Steroidobacteraceae bacterium]
MCWQVATLVVQKRRSAAKLAAIFDGFSKVSQVLVNESVEAGNFGTWLQAMRASLRGEAGTDVPCGDCVGCCVSGYPVPIRPEDALEDVLPAEFLVPVSSVSRMLVA